MRLQLGGAAALVAATLFVREARGQDAPTAKGAASSGGSVVVHATSEYSTYADTDHVFVQTPVISVGAESPTAGWSFGGSYLVDVISAASVDIVSTASRRWEEVRQAGTANAAYKPGNFGVAVNGNVSSEPDYLSWSAGATVTEDLLEKNVTLLFGYDHGHDTAGRTGTPFSVFSNQLDRDWLKGGATFLLDRASVLSIVGDLVLENGDQSKPYRYIPMFAPGTYLAPGATIDQVNARRLDERPLEQLPTSRQRYALSARYAHRYGTSTIRLDERLYFDSWELFSSSTDARYLFDLGRRVTVGPHARVHAQNGVDFWERTYVVRPGFDFPALRTGDRELGPLVNVTGGWSFKDALGAAADPQAWVLGVDLNVTETRYLDDLYVTRRVSAIGSVTLDARF